MYRIKHVYGQEILDSRGNPTVEAGVVLEDGSGACAQVPSGASTGKYEALELRDKDPDRYAGRGVLFAVENIDTKICEELKGANLCQAGIDLKLLRLDGKRDKSNLGANALLAVSLACAKAGAQAAHLPLYKYIGGINAVRLPIPMMNILNGGVHASNSLDVQEIMIVPKGFDSFTQALRAGSEIYHVLGEILKAENKSVSVGDEGGYAPRVENAECAFELVLRAIEKAGYTTDEVKLAMDCAAGEWYSGGKYIMPKSKKEYSAMELCDYYESLADKYPLISIEDGLGDDDTEGWKYMTKKLSDRLMLVGDDLFVTDTKRLKEGVEKGIGNAVLIKPNQVGTLWETLEVMRLAKESSYKTIVSHRSGDTEDTLIADIAVGMNAGYIKCGAPCRSERVAKYNRLLKIEAQLGCAAVYGDNCY